MDFEEEFYRRTFSFSLLGAILTGFGTYIIGEEDSEGGCENLWQGSETQNNIGDALDSEGLYPCSDYCSQEWWENYSFEGSCEGGYCGTSLSSDEREVWID